MLYKSTIEKGDSFEKQVFTTIRDLLSTDSFMGIGKQSRIFHKKGYYSKERDSNIITDISIETFIGESIKYSLLFILECKNLSGPVPVDDIEEFDSKLRQIGEHNLKGIMVSSSGFQKSTIKFAIAKGIMLLNIKENKEIKYVNYRKDRTTKAISNTLIELKLLSQEKLETNLFALINNKPFDYLPDLLIELRIIDYFKNIPKYLNPPYLSDSLIQKRVESQFTDVFYQDNRINYDVVCEYLGDIYGVDFEFDDLLDDNILGKIELDPLKICISSRVERSDRRWHFTFAHEIGHLILHYNILKEYLDTSIDSEDHINFNLSDSIQMNKRLEIQANIFAGNLLMPLNPLLRQVDEYFRNNRIHKGYLYLDHQSVNQNLVFGLLSIIQRAFNVSKEAAKYRIIGLGLLIDKSNYSIGNLMRKQL